MIQLTQPNHICGRFGIIVQVVGLPIMQPTKIEQMLNFRTAKALDLTVLTTLPAAVDEVME